MYEIPSEIIVQAVEDEMVLLNTFTGDYFRLNKVGTEIFSELQAHGDKLKTIHSLVEKYDVSEEQIKSDVEVIIKRLLGLGIVLKSIS